MLLLCASFLFLATAGGVPTPAILNKDLEQMEAIRASRALHPPSPSLQHTLWQEKAQAALKKMVSKEPNTKKAQSIVLFMGDGMSVATVAAARILNGQRLGLAGEEYALSFEEFPFSGLSKTYCVDKQVADSACSATAYLGGVKTTYGVVGVTSNVKRKDCQSSLDPENHVQSIAMWAQKAGKSTGFVTTTRITHASPAGTYGHSSERDWECDVDVKKENDPLLCLDLAQQLVKTEPGMNFKVIMGGGRKKFLPNTTTDEDGIPGQREDGQDLLREWHKDKLARGASAAIVTDRKGLLATPSSADYLMGIFDSDHMQYHMDADPETEPTLAEMTEAAIKILSKDDNGFFLFVEGGKIDLAHHDNLAHKALDETIELSKAVKVAEEMLGDDVLIVVTADHAHTMSFSGYGERGASILGFGGNDTNSLPYPILSYANGPSYKPEENGRRNMTMDDYQNSNYTFFSPAPLKSETHGGEDVQVFARGPWAHLFTGAYEQNIIPHLMAFASCIGDGHTVCQEFKINDNSLK